MDGCYNRKQNGASKSEYGTRGHWEDDLLFIAFWGLMEGVLGDGQNDTT